MVCCIGRILPLNIILCVFTCAQTSTHVSLSEFDKFLEDRAKAADNSIQTIHSVPSTTPRQPPPQSTRKEDTSHDQLFAL